MSSNMKSKDNTIQKYRMKSLFAKVMKYEKLKSTCAQDPAFAPPLLVHSASVQHVPLRPEEPSQASFENL